MCIFALQSFNLRMPFDFIPTLPCLGGLVDECVGEATWLGIGQMCVTFCQDVSSGPYIHEPVLQLWRVLSIKCEDILEDGCGEIGFPLGYMQVSVYACMVLCTGSSLDSRVGWSAMVRCCSLSVSCDSSSLDVDWGVLDFKLANWFLLLELL